MLVALVLSALGLMLWGSRLLVVGDPLPAHVDAAVVLQGSVVAEKARLDGAVQLLRQGVADRVLISLPRESYWGQSTKPIALRYIEKQYGSELASKMDFCETGPEVESTRQEAQAIRVCIGQRSWRTLVVVTSDYHTRRARFIWKNAMHQSAERIWIKGISEPDFQPAWWRSRHSAKTFVMEFSKLLWTLIAER